MAMNEIHKVLHQIRNTAQAVANRAALIDEPGLVADSLRLITQVKELGAALRKLEQGQKTGIAA
jgi:hypothetical protein